MNEQDLIGCVDARVWADGFVKAVRANPNLATDKAQLAGWFANAIASGIDYEPQDRGDLVEKLARLRKALGYDAANHS